MGVDACLAIISLPGTGLQKIFSCYGQSKAMRPYSPTRPGELDSQPHRHSQKLRRYAGLDKDVVILVSTTGRMERGRMAGPGGGRDDAGEDVGLYEALGF